MQTTSRALTRSLLFLLTACALLSSCRVQAAPPPAPWRDQAALVVVSSQAPGALAAVRERLEAAGAVLPHAMTPDLLIGSVPPAVEKNFAAPDGVSVRFVRPGTPAAASADLPRGAGAALRFLEGPTRHPRTEPLPELGGDFVLPDERDEAEGREVKSLEDRECEPPGALSAYLAGRVAIGIILPESTGSVNSEDWSNADPGHPGDRQDLVIAEIMEGCDALAAQLPLASLSFVYDVHRSVGIDSEPTLIPAGSRGIWIQQCMEVLAFEGWSESASVHAYLRELRDRPAVDADWAVAAFVGDNLNHPRVGWGDSDFPFAYALLGGPYLVMNYKNDGYTIDNMDAVMKHELGHTFNALDEYVTAGNSCTHVAGYLRVENGNNDSDPPCTTDESCIMRGGTADPVCAFTLGQLGIRDTDGDGIIDPREAPPQSELDQASPILTSSADVTITGGVTAYGIETESPNSPVIWSINRIGLAEYSLDGGPWQGLVPDDGSFGGRCEHVTIALTGLAEGWHDLDLRGINNLDVVEPSPAHVRIYVNTDCTDDASEPDDARAEARSRPARNYPGLHHCAFDDDWSRFHLSAGADIDLAVTYAPPAMDLGLTLHDAVGNVLATGTSLPGSATLNYTAVSAASYYLRVSTDEEIEGDYALNVVADCIDDVFEPNATPASAALASATTHPDLALCAGDLDHYALSVQAGETLSADLVFDGVLGDIDLEILDPLGASAGVSNGTGNSELVTITPTVQGVYVVKVNGKTPADTNVYSMDLAASGCLDDLRENDDDALTARAIAPGEEVRGRICGADEDWYAFHVSAYQLVRLQASFDPGAANLDLELRDAAGTTLLGQSRTLGGFEDITSERMRPGDYLLRVFAADRGQTSYVLTFESVDPILLMVHKDPSDAQLSWSEAQQECYVVRRSVTPSDFTGAVEVLIESGDESMARTDYIDRGVITDGIKLYCYLVTPADCGNRTLRVTKTASPYPILPPAIGGLPSITYTITLTNDGTEDLFGIQLTDDVPAPAFAFAVTETPPGSTDASAPSPAGAFGRGLIQVTGINVPHGGSAVVRFWIQVGRSTTDFLVVDNQATGAQASTPVDPSTFVVRSDDPATTVLDDETRVMLALGDQRPHVYSMWHRRVDMDMRVIDPCGNVISPQDSLSGTCGTQTISVERDHSCSVPGVPDRFAAVGWSGFGNPPSGDYRIEMDFVEDASTNPSCGGRGVDEVTVAYIPSFGAPVWTTVQVVPGLGFVPVLEFTVP